jgi:hypothetical protein
MDENDPKDGRDRFGLPIPPSGPETANARRWRKAIARREAEMVLAELFSKLKRNLGEAEAREFFDRYSTPRRPGRRGPSDYKLDARLLDLYDVLAETTDDKASIPRLIGQQLHHTSPRQFGNSPDAIEKRIRRLLKAREKKAAAEAATRKKIEQLRNGINEMVRQQRPLSQTDK